MRKRRFSHRSRIETISCILKNCNKGSGKTRLIYACNLNVSQFDRYTNFLVEAGLLEILRLEAGKELLETTEAGKEFFIDCSTIKSILDKSKQPER